MTDPQSIKKLVNLIELVKETASEHQLSPKEVLEAIKILEMQRSNNVLDQMETRLGQIYDEMYRG